MSTTKIADVPARNARPRGLIAGLLVAAACLAAIPQSALAASTPTTNAINYRVDVNQGVLAGNTANNVVNAVEIITNQSSGVSNWWSQGTVATVVRKGVNAKNKKPYMSQGFHCTSTAKGKSTAYTCTITAKGVSTTAKLTFTVRYRVSAVRQLVVGGAAASLPYRLLGAPITLKSDGQYVVIWRLNQPAPRGGHDRALRTAANIAGVGYTGQAGSTPDAGFGAVTLNDARNCYEQIIPASGVLSDAKVGASHRVTVYVGTKTVQSRSVLQRRSTTSQAVAVTMAAKLGC